jgi:predicted GNAT family N-acyltransferase
MSITIELTRYADAIAPIQFVRKTVFQDEQGVEAAIEFDGQDDTAQHLIAYMDGMPVGTARLRPISDRVIKIERVAVLATYRGQGLGKQLMEAALEWVRSQNVSTAKIHAQLAVQSFYEKLGFQAQGAVFYEAGIPHIEMHKSLANK